MQDDEDEQAIRDLVAGWQRAAAAGDVTTLKGMMDEEVVFLTPGNPPMRGRDAFVASFQQFIGQHRLESTAEVQEVRVLGGLGVLLGAPPGYRHPGSRGSAAAPRGLHPHHPAQATRRRVGNLP